MPRRRLRNPKLHKSGVPIEKTKTVHELAQSLGYSPGQFEVIAVTDGSGGRHGKPMGYAAVYSAGTHTEQLIYGRCSSGSSQLAELDAILAICRWAHANKLYKTKRGAKMLFITDSALVERVLRAVAKDPVRLYNSAAHPDLAAAVLAFARRGLRFVVHRIARNSSPVHAGVDAASRAARLNQDPETAFEHAVKQSPKRKDDGKEG